MGHQSSRIRETSQPPRRRPAVEEHGRPIPPRFLAQEIEPGGRSRARSQSTVTQPNPRSHLRQSWQAPPQNVTYEDDSNPPRQSRARHPSHDHHNPNSPRQGTQAYRHRGSLQQEFPNHNSHRRERREAEMHTPRGSQGRLQLMELELNQLLRVANQNDNLDNSIPSPRQSRRHSIPVSRASTPPPPYEEIDPLQSNSRASHPVRNMEGIRDPEALSSRGMDREMEFDRDYRNSDRNLIRNRNRRPQSFSVPSIQPEPCRRGRNGPNVPRSEYQRSREEYRNSRESYGNRQSQRNPEEVSTRDNQTGRGYLNQDHTCRHRDDQSNERYPQNICTCQGPRRQQYCPSSSTQSRSTHTDRSRQNSNHGIYRANPSSLPNLARPAYWSPRDPLRRGHSRGYSRGCSGEDWMGDYGEWEYGGSGSSGTDSSDSSGMDEEGMDDSEMDDSADGGRRGGQRRYSGERWYTKIVVR